MAIHGGRAAVEQLFREHGNVAVLLVMLDSYFAAIKAGEEVDDALLLDAIGYLTQFVHDVHHAREQLAVERASERGAPLDEVRAELERQHRRIGGSGRRMRARLEGALLDEPMPRGSVADDGFAYTAEIRRNIEYEEARVLPALATALGDDAWSRIWEHVGAIDDPLFGEAADRRYARLLRELTERFVDAPG